MEFLSTDKILIIDLNTAEVSEDDVDEEIVAENIGGAGMNKHLYDEYESDDPIVIGSGLLTGTLYPASALGVVTGKSPVTGKIAHSPLTLKTGVEIKYAGFDYIVIKGKSEKPVYIWIHDGVADIEDASDVWGKDVWETTDAWRERVGDDLLQTIVIGPAGEKGSDIAQVCTNYWSTGDRFGFGKVFGQKNVKGLAIRGMGLLEIAEPDEFIDLSLELLEEVKNGAWKDKKGVGDICSAIGEADISDWIAPLVHRHSACYNTPYATGTFLYLDEDPKLLKESEKKEPGVLITDIPGLIGLKKLGLSAKDAGEVLKQCARYGVDPMAAVELAEKAGKKTADDIKNALPDLSGAPTIPGKGVFSPWAPMKPVFGDFEDAGNVDEWWERRQAVAYIFGIHPIFAVMSPELTEDSMIELANVGADLDIDEETLDNVISKLS